MTSESPTDLDEIRTELEYAEQKLARLYREEVWPLREAYAAAAPPAELPKARNRTAKQDLVARCPRCGGRLESEEAPE